MQKAFQSRTQLFAKIEALLFGALIFSLTAYSQGSTYLIKAGKHPAKVLPDTVQFQYPDFQKGMLVLPMGEKSPVILLNYNLLYATIQLINENGDTLALDESANIVEYVRIESDLYFRDHKEGYCLIVSKEGPIKVVVRFKLNIVRLFLQNEDVYFRKDYDYFFLAQKNKLFKPTKTSLHKLYPEHKKAIQIFISENNVNFGNESDLTTLISYCNSLTSGTNPTE
ncbi:MAG TPA: hypothetical protein VK589_12960 [Chryseolinea sp.]|nr:hypothetical protein [Chryseolinea sp.]